MTSGDRSTGPTLQLVKPKAAGLCDQALQLIRTQQMWRPYLPAAPLLRLTRTLISTSPRPTQAPSARHRAKFPQQLRAAPASLRQHRVEYALLTLKPSTETPETERPGSKSLTTNLLSCLEPLNFEHKPWSCHTFPKALAASPHLERQRWGQEYEPGPSGRCKLPVTGDGSCVRERRNKTWRGGIKPVPGFIEQPVTFAALPHTHTHTSKLRQVAKSSFQLG